MTDDEPTFQATCGDCGADLPQTVEPCECGSTTRNWIGAPIVARVVATARVPVRSIKSDERVESGKRAFEGRFGPNFNRDAGQMYEEARIVDRKNDRYMKTLHDEDGELVLHVDKPLSDHMGHGADRSREES